MVADFRRVFLLALAVCVVVGCNEPILKQYAPPARTNWRPEGCRPAPAAFDAMPLPVTCSRTVHADTACSDEFSVALTPMFEFEEWNSDTEKNLFVPEGPSYDKDGNLYFSPLWPRTHEALVALNPEDGTRRWQIYDYQVCVDWAEGAVDMTFRGDGGSAPLVLDDQDADELKDGFSQTLYLGLSDRAFAVRPDGTFVWVVNTGVDRASLTPGIEGHCFGLNYLPQQDAVVGLLGAGYVYVLDRKTGRPLLSEPFQLNGLPSPPADIPDVPRLYAQVDKELEPLLGGAPEGVPLTQTLIQALLGGKAVVANYFAIDPHTGRMWITSTTPEAREDGYAAGGVLFGLQVVEEANGQHSIDWEHRVEVGFGPGGSATTPTLSADGTVVYVGDSDGYLVAINSDGTERWRVDVHDQIAGSVSASSDNKEIYCSTLMDVIKVVESWDDQLGKWVGKDTARTTLNTFDAPPGMVNFNVLLVGCGANGLILQVGAGYTNYDVSYWRDEPAEKDNRLGILHLTLTLPFKVALAYLDRDTLEVKYAAEGREESVAVVTARSDGTVFLGQSPVRRALARVLFRNRIPQLVGGIGKYAIRRADLLIRDAMCAAADRAANASAHAAECAPDSLEADLRQIKNLITQCRDVAPRALADGDLTENEWEVVEAYLASAEEYLTVDRLDVVAATLGDACNYPCGK